MTTDETALRRKLDEANRLLKDGRGNLEAAAALLAEVLRHATNPTARGRINRQLWDLQRLGTGRGPYFSQAGQDRFLDASVFGGKRDGTFVEIGGYDGVTGSNCLFFELMRGWTGLLIEPSPAYFTKAAAFRRAECLQLAIAAERGRAEFLDIRQGLTQMSGLTASYDQGLRAQVEADPRHKGALIEVETRTLADLLDERDMGAVDYISLDVEGGEMAVLESFPFERIAVHAWSVENNTDDRAIRALMASKGYRLIEVLDVDEIYVRAD